MHIHVKFSWYSSVDFLVCVTEVSALLFICDTLFLPGASWTWTLHWLPQEIQSAQYPSGFTEDLRWHHEQGQPTLCSLSCHSPVDCFAPHSWPQVLSPQESGLLTHSPAQPLLETSSFLQDFLQVNLSATYPHPCLVSRVIQSSRQVP